ncbi:double-strand break repair protein AddB [Roseibium suaedae]|uniref:DNA helicase/exodeoxyribonuclease V, subunit B n=1 Tax=Roseibium suaedae TaxID=735517 RepID=A0A1M6ZEI1_9HYPH|nr:double-strand break repair protein AddB [Roseibium suaedae]SHL28902.1 DNA helicase/exodeoxyribonuclease V, subunit B [Roseibium suaedae]
MADRRAAPRVTTIPPSVPFLRTLAQKLVDGSLLPGFRPLDDPLLLSTVTLYLPTRRAARLLPEIFQELFGGRPVLLPKILPIGDVDEEDQMLRAERDADPLPPAMPPLERQLAMTRLVLAWKGALRREVLNLKLDEPLGVPASAADAAWLASDLLSLMDEVATEEADWTDLAGLVPEDHARYWQITLDFLKIVQEAWPAHLAQQNRMDPKVRRSLLIRREAERLAVDPPKGPVIVAGATGSVPATAALLKAVAGLENGAIVLPGLDLHLDDESWKSLGGRPARQGQIAAPAGGDSVPGHPQYGLKQLLGELGLPRGDVELLAPVESEALRDREILVSEALRPADTSEGWTGFLAAFPQERRSRALAEVGMITAANEAEEALSVAIALREALERGETAALVSPDRLLARRVANELARWQIQVDDSAGRPLDQTPPAILASLAAQLALDGCDPIDLLSLLKHPLARLGLPVKDIRSAARALERGVLRGPRARAGTAGLREAVLASREAAEKGRTPPRWKKIHDGDWEAILDLVDRLAEALAPLERLAGSYEPVAVTDLAKAHADVMHLLSRDEAGSDAELYSGETGDALAQMLAGLIDAESSGLMVAPHDWPSVFAALMGGISVRRRLPGDPRIQILGPMEARLQSPDLVILSGLNEGIWPQRTRNDPWLNRPMKRDLGLDPPERRIGAAAHDFAQGLGARRVLMSRAARADGAPTVASRWLQRLITLAGPDVQAEMEGRGRVYTRFSAMLDRPEGPVRPAARPEPFPPLAARPKSLSVTEIERLVRDPYAIFAKHVLDLEPVDPIGGEPGAADKGTIIHDALAEFLEAWDGPFDERAVQRLIEVGSGYFAPLDAFPAIRALWWPRFQRIARGFIAFEAERAPEIERRFLEISGGAELKLPGVEFRLRGRADRFDLLKDGSLVVIDYKTGQAPSLKQVESLLAPQLPLEAAMIKRFGFKDVPATAPVSSLLYVQLKGGATPVIPFPRNPKDTDLGDLAEDAWKRLEKLVAHYAKLENGYLSRSRVMMEGRTDGPYDHLARVQEWSAGGEDGE